MKNNVKSIGINGDQIASGTCIRYLGVWANPQLNFKHHIAQKCKTVMLNMQRLKQIRKFLTQEAACVIAQGLIISHLKYCNSIYTGLPASTISPLVQVQTMCAKLILGVSKYHILSTGSPYMREWIIKYLQPYINALEVRTMYLQDLLVNTTPR